MGGGTEDVVARHVAHLRRKNLARSTIYQRSRALARLADAHPDLLAVTHDQIVAHVDRLTAPGTRRTEIMHLAGFYRWALEEGLVGEDPTARVPRPRVPRRLPRPMSDDDKARALAQAPPRLRPMLYLAAYAGLRACEIAGLHAEHVSYEDRIIYVESAKGGGSRAVPMSGVLATALLTCDLPGTGWLFRTVDGRHLAPHRVSQLTNAYLHSIGITATLHTLRHWFATKTLRASGGNLRVTQEAMGHASPATTAIYTQVDHAEIAGVLDLLPV